MTTFETIDGKKLSLHESLITVPPIPPSYFRDGFDAQLAQVFWETESPDFADCVGAASKRLTPEDLLKLGLRIDTEEIAVYGDSPYSVWDYPKEVVVDEDEVVKGIVGTLSNVRDALTESSVVEALLDEFINRLLASYLRWFEENPHLLVDPETLEQQLADEIDRRLALAQHQLDTRLGQTELFQTH